MQHIGIVACSAEGAALCYRTICATAAKALGGHRHPEISMHTQPFEEYVAALEADDWDAVAELMADSANRLASIGADFAICPDNTIHRALPAVAARTSIPWLHIAEIVAEEAKNRGFQRVGVIGTRWLVDGNVYSDALGAHGLECVRPAREDRDEVSRVIMDELVLGVFKPESTIAVCEVIERLQAEGSDAIVLGCTELPLIVDDANSALPTLDSTRLLARAAVRKATGSHV